MWRNLGQRLKTRQIHERANVKPNRISTKLRCIPQRLRWGSPTWYWYRPSISLRRLLEENQINTKQNLKLYYYSLLLLSKCWLASLSNLDWSSPSICLLNLLMSSASSQRFVPWAQTFWWMQWASHAPTLTICNVCGNSPTFNPNALRAVASAAAA